MKQLATLLATATLTITSSLVHANQTTVIKGTASINVSDLACVTHALSKKTTTQVTQNPNQVLHYIELSNESLEINLPLHRLSADGCDLKVLNQIARHSLQNFNAVVGADVTITRNRINHVVDGKCVAENKETVEIDIGKAIGKKQIVSFTGSAFVNADDCQ